MTYAVVAGHNSIIPGASGNGFQEHIVARQIKDRVIYFLRQLGGTAHDCTDEVGRTKTQVWLNAARNCDRAIGKNGHIIAIHLNSSASGSGTGTEVLDYEGTQKDLCERISARLSKDFSWRDRGWKDGSGIGLIKETMAPVIYVEVCFINNVSDITKLTRNIDMAAIGIVEEMTGKKINVAQPKVIVAEEIKEEDIMSQKFEPSVQAIRDSVSKVLLRFESKESELASSWREKANSGELTISDAVGLLYVAVDRGYIVGK